MKSIYIIAVVIVIVGALIYVFYSKGYSNTNTAPNNPTATTSTQVAPNNITIQNYSFSPSTLTVKKGTTVTWTNEDSVAHSIKSATFSSTNLNTGDKFKYTFNNPGTYDYNCGIHPTMTGTVIVQ